MNEVLQLKGTFEQKSNSSTPGAPNLPKNGHVETNHLRKLRQDLNEVLEFWKKDKIISTALVSVYYRDVVAKSNRIKGILAKGSNSPNESVVGAKFSKDGYPKHIITHCVDLETVKNSIDD